MASVKAAVSDSKEFGMTWNPIGGNRGKRGGGSKRDGSGVFSKRAR